MEYKHGAVRYSDNLVHGLYTIAEVLGSTPETSVVDLSSLETGVVDLSSLETSVVDLWNECS